MPDSNPATAQHLRELAGGTCDPVMANILLQLATEYEGAAVRDEIWITRDGTHIAVGDMTEEHVRAVLRKLIRRYGNRLAHPTRQSRAA